MASSGCWNIAEQLERTADVSGPKLLAWYETLSYDCPLEILSQLHSSSDFAPANLCCK